MKRRRLNVGTVAELFRGDCDNLMKDEDDIYILLAAQKFEAMQPENSTWTQLEENSNKVIKKDRVQSMIEMRKENISSTFCDFLAEHFFHAEEWPTYAQKILLAKDFVYLRRLQLAAFFIGNGLVDESIAEKIYKIWNLHWNNTK